MSFGVRPYLAFSLMPGGSNRYTLEGVARTIINDNIATALTY